MASTAVSAIQGQTGAPSPDSNVYGKLDVETFTKLLVVELQNQDPLSPMDSAQMVQQISQIRSIQASTELSTTLHAVLLGQNVATASSLIGRRISGLADDAKPITGQVDKVSIADGVAKLHVGGSTVDLKNVSEILPDGGA